MTTLDEFRTYGEDLQQLLLLRSHPLAIKMLETEADIPEDAMRPLRDQGQHFAQCQAFALSRLRGETIAMLKEDNWCWGPLTSYGLVDPSVASKYEKIRRDIEILPSFERGKYVGIVSAPLSSASFEPDMVMIYSNVAQLNNMLLALMLRGEGPVNSSFFPTGSCGFSVVPACLGDYYITIPDMGEQGRAFTAEDELIFSVPAAKVEGLVSQLAKLNELGAGYRHHAFVEITPDFARPQFYKDVFRDYGLCAEDEATREPV